MSTSFQSIFNFFVFPFKEKNPPWMHLCFFCEDFCWRGAWWGGQSTSSQWPKSLSQRHLLSLELLAWLRYMNHLTKWHNIFSGSGGFGDGKCIGKSRKKMWEFGNHPYYSHKNFFWMMGLWRSLIGPNKSWESYDWLADSKLVTQRYKSHWRDSKRSHSGHKQKLISIRNAVPETNSLPTQKIGGDPKRKAIFQPSIFRCENVSFRLNSNLQFDWGSQHKASVHPGRESKHG